jgi:hypothetical protein
VGDEAVGEGNFGKSQEQYFWKISVVWKVLCGSRGLTELLYCTEHCEYVVSEVVFPANIGGRVMWWRTHYQSSPEHRFHFEFKRQSLRSLSG